MFWFYPLTIFKHTFHKGTKSAVFRALVVISLLNSPQVAEFGLFVGLFTQQVFIHPYSREAGVVVCVFLSFIPKCYILVYHRPSNKYFIWYIAA